MDQAQLFAVLARDLAGRYALDAEILATGGMALVYGARDLRHGRRVAIKVLRPEQAIVFGAERFLREINLTAGFQHPHILPLLDSGTVDLQGLAVPYYVMPLVVGRSLRTKLDIEGRLSARAALAIARDVAEGLQYAHDRGVIHRDIKPENILLGESDAALIVDFGVARATGGAPAGLTEGGTTVGTPSHMSPEQLFDTAPVEPRSDQFSLAATIFEMLAGRPPYLAETREALLARRLSGPPDRLRDVRDDLAPELEAVLAKGLALDPAERYPSVRDLLEAMTAAVERPGSPAVSARPARRWLGASMAIAVAAAALLAWYLNRPVRSLSDGAMVVLADVENLTADSTLGPALRVAAAVGLGQSSSFSVYPRSRLGASLARMGRTTADTVLSESLAREVAARESGHAVIVLTVADVGGRRTLAARVVDPSTGAYLASHRVAVDRPERLLDAVDRVVEWVRNELGDAAAGRAAPLPFLTTPSLEALRTYADARAALDRFEWAGARTLLTRAIELDTGFAMAQMLLGQLHIITNQIPAGLHWLREADRRTARLAEYEQLNVKALLARAEGRTDDHVALAQSLAERFPSRGNWMLYGEALRLADRDRDAIAAFEQVLARDSNDPEAYLQLAIAHKGAGDHRLALDHFARADRLDSTLLHTSYLNQLWGETYVATGDLAGAEADFRRMLGRPDPRDQARDHRALAYLALYRGRFGEAAASLRRSIPLQPRGGLSEYRDQLLLADTELTRGEQAAARAALDRAFEIFRTADIQAAAVMFGGHQFIRAGQLARGQLLLDSLRARAALRPASGQDQTALAILAADVALARRRFDEARAALAAWKTDEYDALRLSLHAELLASTDRYDSAVAVAKAATERRVFGLETQQDWLRSFTQLAILAETAGDSATAREAYSALIERWRDGDPDLPPLISARRALARLQTAVPR